MQPGNPIVGSTILRRPAIQSPNYVPGVSGWIIRADGSAEFNSGTFRGPVIIGTTPPAQGTLEFGLTTTSTPAIPAVLTGFSADYTWFEANLQYISSTDFFFQALVSNSVFSVTEWITGIYTVANGVQIQSLVESTANTLNFGSSVYDTVALTVGWRKTITTYDSSSTLAVQGTLETQTTGDTHQRWSADNAGALHWGTGAGATDTTAYRSSAGVLAVDVLVHNVTGSAETWHTQTLGNSWTGTLRARLSVDNMVEVTSSGLTPGTKADGTLVFTLPTGYRPANATDLPVVVNSMGGATAQSPHFAIGTNGQVSCWGCANATGANVNGRFPLD